MKERLRLQRQHGQQLSSGNSQGDEAEQHPPSSTAASCYSSEGTQVQSPPVKGRRFQRSRHAEQQARSRSQDATKNDRFFGFAGGPRPLQKSKSIDTNLEKIATGANCRSHTVSVEVDKLAVADGSRKVGKKGSFLFRSSSLLARLSGRSGQKKLQSPSPLRNDGSQSVENPDDSVGASADQSVLSSASGKTTSLSDSGHLEVSTSLNLAEVEHSDTRQPQIMGQPSVFQSISDKTQTSKAGFTELQATNNKVVCRCPTFVKSSHIPTSRSPWIDSKCPEKADALEHGSEIVLAAELRQGLSRQTSENCITSHKLGIGEHQVSVSTGNLLSRIPQERSDVASGGDKYDGTADASTQSSLSTTVPRDPVSLDLALVTTASACCQNGEYSCAYFCCVL